MRYARGGQVRGPDRTKFDERSWRAAPSGQPQGLPLHLIGIRSNFKRKTWAGHRACLLQRTVRCGTRLGSVKRYLSRSVESCVGNLRFGLRMLLKGQVIAACRCAADEGRPSSYRMLPDYE